MLALGSKLTENTAADPAPYVLLECLAIICTLPEKLGLQRTPSGLECSSKTHRVPRECGMLVV